MTTASGVNEPLLDRMLAHLTIDWSYPSWIATSAGRVAANADDRRTLALGVIAQGVLADLVTIGTLEDDGFEPMSGASQDNLVAIAHDWLSSPEPTDTWDLCWFAATDAGRKRGEAVVAARDPDHPHETANGSCEFTPIRDMLRRDEVRLGEVLDAIDDHALLPQDRTALALGIVLEGLVTSQVQPVHPQEDPGLDIALLFTALMQGDDVHLRAVSPSS